MNNMLFICFSGYLYGHVSYLADDCEACLLLLSVDREQFFTLSEAKQKIVDVSYGSPIFMWKFAINIVPSQIFLVSWYIFVK